jgi:hypothetical protein
MQQIHARIVAWGTRVSPLLLVGAAIGLNIYWFVTLSAFDTQFRQLSGYPLLDLQNDLQPERMITAAKVRTQIATYSQEAKTLYWSFFILDNIMPPLTFSSVALLWVYFLHSNPNPFFNRLLNSYFVLIPVGVGFFDWFENLGYIAAIHSTSDTTTNVAIYLGLTFKWIKAACVVPTFPVLFALVIYHICSRTWYRLAARRSA